MENQKIWSAIIVLFVMGITLVISLWSEKYKNKKLFSMSFKETLDLTELPIITFLCGEKKLNFLLDTGANKSFINESILDEIKYKELNGGEPVTSIGGKQHYSKFGRITLQYKDKEFDVPIGIINLDGGFDEIKLESGVQLHGILGNDFFQKYRYIIDFNELIIYVKH